MHGIQKPHMHIIRHQQTPWEQQKQHHKVGCLILLHNCCGDGAVPSSPSTPRCYFTTWSFFSRRAHQGPTSEELTGLRGGKSDDGDAEATPPRERCARRQVRACTHISVPVSSSHDWTITTETKPGVPPRLLCDKTSSRVINPSCFH
ncbi:hypothetical protein AMECASPLE_023712 [Ameca splendens]|uniref:Uncharacterized protein n=1 Tax=Ameca splendens TaxID=208324 RepID=A0ABV1A0D5_9TELE